MMVTATTLSYLDPSQGVAYSSDRTNLPIDVRAIFPGNLSAATNQHADTGFDHHYVKLQALGKDLSLLPPGAEPPSVNAQVLASVMLRQLQAADQTPPTRVVASAEGGVAICFVSSNKYADVEFLNTGEILGVVSNRHDTPIVWQIGQSPREFMAAAFRISRFIHSSAPSKDAPRGSWGR
jgi:hypothetical protein